MGVAVGNVSITPDELRLLFEKVFVLSLEAKLPYGHQLPGLFAQEVLEQRGFG